MSNHSDGYVRVIEADDMDLGDENLVAGRAAFRALPTDDLTIDLTFDLTSSSDNGAPMILTGLRGTSAFTGFYNEFLTGGQCSPAPGPLNNPICYNEQWMTGHDAVHGQPEQWYSQLDIWGSSLTIAWNLPHDVTLTSLTSYRHTDSEVSREQDRSPLTINRASNDWTHEQWSQEVQLAQSRERLKWIFGLYAFGEKGTDINDVHFPIGSIRSGGSVDNSNHAAYANVTFDLTRQLSLDLGLRYTSDEKRFTPDQYFLTDVFLGPPPPLPAGTRLVPDGEVSRKFTETTPSLSLSYQWTDDFMTYARYSEGFKSGGFTQRVAFPRPDVPSFAPEYVEVYEVGAKSTVLDNRLRVNVAAFYTDYTDLQVNFLESPASPAPITGNAAAAKLKGGELEIDAVPIDRLRIAASLGYLDAEYDSFAPGALLTTAYRPVYAPEWTGSVTASYEIVIAGGSVITPRIDFSYRSAIEYDAFNEPRARQSAYSLVHAGVAWEIDERWRAAFDVNNLFDDFYITSGYVDLSASGYSEAGRGRPREWMVSLRRTF